MATAPSGLSATSTGTSIDIVWTNEDVYTAIEVWRIIEGDASWTIMVTLGTFDESWTDTETFDNKSATYKVRGDTLVGYTDYSNEDSATLFSDTETDICSISDSKTEGVSSVCTDVCSVVDSKTEGVSSTCTDTCNVTDSQAGSQSVKSLFVFYWGTSDGYVHTYSDAYKSDNGASILSSWRSKTTDFSELEPSLAGKWKTVYRIKVLYRDLESSTPAIVSISNDCGSTWTSYTKNLGTATLATQSRDYWVTPMTGEFFEFKIEFPSTDKTFQFLGFEIEFEPFGERVDL